ncbi:MAG: tryptophan--tRNA ligase, partial [Candidatus Marsarchaeota archaeon]|nr:tryptophan--tRNA ligase [Candidatus Marsarchaeota archaeon]
MENFEVTPYEVSGDVDYNKLAKRFGISHIDDKLRERIFRLAGEPNFLISRGIYFAHRDMQWLLDKYEHG